MARAINQSFSICEIALRSVIAARIEELRLSAQALTTMESAMDDAERDDGEKSRLIAEARAELLEYELSHIRPDFSQPPPACDQCGQDGIWEEDEYGGRWVFRCWDCY